MSTYETAHRNLNRFIKNETESIECIRVVTLICNYYLKQMLFIRLDALWQYEDYLEAVEA